MIKIKLKCFSQVKYAFGKSEISYELKEGTTIKEFEKIRKAFLKFKINTRILSFSVLNDCDRSIKKNNKCSERAYGVGAP